MTLYELWITIGQLSVVDCLGIVATIFILARITRRVIREFHAWEDEQYFIGKRKLK